MTGAMLAFVLLIAASARTQTTQPASQPGSKSGSLTVTVTYDSAIADSFTGRVYVMFSNFGQEPRFGPRWFGTDPFFALDVNDWKPQTPLIFDDGAIGFPDKLSAVPEHEYSVQAVMRRNLDSPSIGEAPGDAYSDVLRGTLNGAAGSALTLRIAQVVAPQSFKETDRIKLVELRSPTLSDFHHRDIMMRATVILPRNYEASPKRRYPALYWIGGFGSDHRDYRFVNSQWERTGYADHIVRVVLDPLCYGGHHVFADSDNNGPRGKALIEELIPHLEKTLRLVAAPTARFVSGHSSGGWSSLWLQVTYPDFFGGVWSIAPDPVDFRDFQRINLYQPGVNMYKDEHGNPRPIARVQDRVLGLYEPFVKMEIPYGDGGQIRSFEWVFSHKGTDGRPEMLFNRQTGAVDSIVADSWKRYDIRLILEENWQTLGPKLNSGEKLHVFVGDEDTFYLDGAVKLLKESQQNLKSAAVIEIVPGRDHGSIASPDLRLRIDRELVAIFNKNHPEFALPDVYD